MAVLQSNYIPWRGYFDIIHDVNEFVFYDEVQFTTRDWRSRNYIYGKNGKFLLTISCFGGRDQAISDVKIMPIHKHFDSIRQAYSKSPFFHKYVDFFADTYLNRTWKYLSHLNQYLIENISRQFLGISTKFTNSKDYISKGTKHTKLLNLVKATGATSYLSGPAAKDYIIEQDYTDNNIGLIWKDYSGYPEYTQMRKPFEHSVSILDLLFNVGDEAPYYIWGWRND